MSAANTSMPTASAIFVHFVQRLRPVGFVVSPEQTATFIEAVGLLGPRDMRDIYRAARATLAPPIDRIEEFDAMFRLVFFGQSVSAAASGDDEDDVEAYDARDGEQDVLEGEEINEVGEQASSAEALSSRAFAPADDADVLRRFRREAGHRLPRQRTLRRRRSRHGDRWDMRRTLRDAARRDGEVFEIPRLARDTRQRRIVVLIDVSGSMKNESERSLRFAHALTRSAESVETFTLGTRLTRVTRALKQRDPDRALATAGALVSDFDGGTRLGDALLAYLAVPRFAGFARGALVTVISDGLERGEPDAMASAVERLSRLAWRITWLTPLMADPRYVPQTAALLASRRYIDELADGSSLEALCAHMLGAGDRRTKATRAGGL